MPADAVMPELVGLILDDAHLASSISQPNPDLPDTPSLQEALSGPKQDRWHSAILEELAAIREASTWDLIDHSPSIHNVIRCHFILQKKCGPNREVTRYKAHLIAQ